MDRTLRFWTFLATASLLAGPPGVSRGEAGAPNPALRVATARAANRLTHLDVLDPYFPGRASSRLVTPQWVGEPGVEAVVVLAIDDLRDTAKYEAYLRSILERLKKIDGRAPLSIMTNSVDPTDPQIQAWIAAGLNLDVHTLTHPCPLLKDGDFAKAKAACDGCLDLLAGIQGNRPVAFRMPCCDSLNTVSPRFYAEIFNRVTPSGRFLEIDSSVFNILTSNDPALPRELVVAPDGEERFRRYLPFPSFVNTIEDYPYPYVIGQLCWEFPCVVPSDWSAQHVQMPNNPRTVEDWKAALDAVVVKQGVFNLVFHPHNWIRPEQVVELVDYAETKYGARVKFLNFRDAAERLSKHLLAGETLRDERGGDNGVRVLDLSGDGFDDVLIGNARVKKTRLWSPQDSQWVESESPLGDLAGEHEPRFGTVGPAQQVVCIISQDGALQGFRFEADHWVADAGLVAGLDLPASTAGLRMADIDGDGSCELLVADEATQAAFTRDTAANRWQRLDFAWPAGARFVVAGGHDRGLRLVDLNDDFGLDLLYSNEAGYGVHLFDSLDKGWGAAVMQGAPTDEGALPMIVRGATNGGAWFHSRRMWVQNEDTARLKDLVDRRSFNDILATVTPRPLSPAASLVALKPRDGMTVDLVAAEPLVVDPVAFDWGPDGRFWVVEMHDYPQGIGKDRKPGGRVRCLHDDDGDGQYDRSSIFLDGLRFPTSIAAWRNGVLISAAPEIIYAEDTDGDDVADRREALYTGFSTGNPQHQMNGLQRGLDGWFYCANGHSEGEVRSTLTGDVVNVSNRDFRIHPATGRIETEMGATQFIRSRDDWGNWFGNSNVDPLWQYVLEDRYLRRNPHVAYVDGRTAVPEMPGSAPVFARSRTVARFNDLHTADHFTSACSTIIYRDELLGPSFAGNSFVSEPVHNLVHRELMRPAGAAFSSRRAADEAASEFLASSDTYFRPAMVQTGPDGAVWVADMYRLVIEHPEWIPPAVLKQIDVRAGDDRGRIYRVYPVGAKPRPIVKLAELDVQGLVGAMESPNGPQRDMASQLLVERADKAAVEPLEQLFRESQRPQVRLQSLATLDQLQAMTPELLALALADQHPGVRRFALRLSEPWLEKAASDAPPDDLGQAVLKLLDDRDATVRLQLACSLGAWRHAEAGKALARIAMTAGDDPLLLAAVSSSAPGCLIELVEALAVEAGSARPPAALVSDLLATATAMDRTDVLGTLLAVIVRPTTEGYAAWQLASLAGLLDALGRRKMTLETFAAEHADELPRLSPDLQKAFAYARAQAANDDAPLEDRVVAAGLLGQVLATDAEAVKTLVALLGPQQPAQLQDAAVEALAESRTGDVPAQLFAAWRGYSPNVRAAILDVMLRRSQWIDACLDALESGAITATELDALRRQRLLENSREEVRERAGKIFAAQDQSRREVLAQYRPVLNQEGHAEAGREVFKQRCSVCHKYDGAGHAVGPDLSALVNKSPEALLVAILDPNAALESRYANYTAVTAEGLTFTGLLAAETDTAVTLVGQEGQQKTLLRSELEALESAGKSLMPEGLEKDIPPAAMADLLAYLRAVAPTPKTFEGNTPAAVVVDALRGELFCLADNAEIYGTSLVFEPVNNNLGYWSSEDDRAIWTLEVRRSARYAVMLEWAVPDDSAGNEYLLEVGGQRLHGRVEGTGSWNNFRRQTIGEVRLENGTLRLGLRASGPIAGALFDLKSITLRPIGR